MKIGPIGLALGGLLYVNYTTDNYDHNVTATCDSIVTAIKKITKLIKNPLTGQAVTASTTIGKLSLVIFTLLLKYI